MDSNFFVPAAYSTQVASGKTTWQTPSNIALVKYWGKKEVQIPQNASVSFTLSNCHTTTTLEFQKANEIKEVPEFDIYLDDVPTPDFKPKIVSFFRRIEAYVPFLKEYTFTIRTSNSFPHSSGIASSASGMGALALCIMDIEKELNPDMSEAFFYQKASFLARFVKRFVKLLGLKIAGASYV